jgi:hypothetical protein
MDAFNSNTRLKQEESQVEIKSHSFTPSGDHFLNTFKVIWRGHRQMSVIFHTRFFAMKNCP